MIKSEESGSKKLEKEEIINDLQPNKHKITRVNLRGGQKSKDEKFKINSSGKASKSNLRNPILDLLSSQMTPTSKHDRKSGPKSKKVEPKYDKTADRLASIEAKRLQTLENARIN